MNRTLYPNFQSPVLARRLAKERILRLSGRGLSGGLGAYCDDQQTQAVVGGSLDALAILGGALASGSGTSAQVGKTGAQLAQAADSFQTQWCADTQGAVTGTVNGPQGSAEINAMLQTSQAQVQSLVNQMNANQALQLQQQQQQQQQRNRMFMYAGGAVLAGAALYLFLR